MPVVCPGRKAEHPLGPSGSNVCKLMKKSGWFKHTLQDGTKNKATVSICVKRARCKDRHGTKKTDTWVDASWGITPRRVDWVKDTYRKRFGIETSYRPMNQCRIRTTTKKFNVRFFISCCRARDAAVAGTTGKFCEWKGCCFGWSMWQRRCMDWSTK